MGHHIGISSFYGLVSFIVVLISYHCLIIAKGKDSLKSQLVLLWKIPSIMQPIHVQSQSRRKLQSLPSIKKNSSVDQVDVGLSSGKVTHNQTSEIKTSESVAEEFEKFTEAVKEKVSSGTSTQFNKALQKFRKWYESFTENQKSYSISKHWFNICWEIKK